MIWAQKHISFLLILIFSSVFQNLEMAKICDWIGKERGLMHSKFFSSSILAIQICMQIYRYACRCTTTSTRPQTATRFVRPTLHKLDDPPFFAFQILFCVCVFQCCYVLCESEKLHRRATAPSVVENIKIEILLNCPSCWIYEQQWQNCKMNWRKVLNFVPSRLTPLFDYKNFIWLQNFPMFKSQQMFRRDQPTKTRLLSDIFSCPQTAQ